ncbi:MAG TPA: cell envelope integrity protein CreD [Bacteroidales bacterium]
MVERTKKSLTTKGLIISALIFLLLIPTFFINNLVYERQSRQEEAFTEISSKWAQAQTIAGPIVTIPYFEFFRETNGTIQKTKKYIHILPEKLTITGKITPEKRYRGIYETVVYTSELDFTGNFQNLNQEISGIPTENMLLDQASISMGISDLRGIQDNVSIIWNNESHYFNSGVESDDIYKSGISTRLIFDEADSLYFKYNFSVKMNLRGSQYLNFIPVGKETNVILSSDWNSPSFDGAFLPDSREVQSSGFSAYWKILHLNRNFPQMWVNSAFSVDDSAFGVNLILPVDIYTKTDRSIKYAILFIALTFLIFFFLELINNKPIHPLQYILVGFALCIFYILLLSISEHIHFNLAYLISSIMTIGLISWYSAGILKDKKLAALVGGNLIILYGFIFTIIQLEDMALLVGSLGLFLILAVVMYFSRKIDWANM